ncbi:MAG: 50S ribosomal protein L17, partial [candidate division WOR-3 bacterium]
TVASRREVVKFISDKALVKKLFDTIAPRFQDRAGGWTRIYRLGPRDSDGAEMAILELVVRKERDKEKAAREKAGRKSGPDKADK